MGKWEEGNYTFPLFHNYTILSGLHRTAREMSGSQLGRWVLGSSGGGHRAAREEREEGGGKREEGREGNGEWGMGRREEVGVNLETRLPAAFGIVSGLYYTRLEARLSLRSACRLPHGSSAPSKGRIRVSMVVASQSPM